MSVEKDAVDAFFRDGFVVLDGLFDGSSVNEISNDFDAIVGSGGYLIEHRFENGFAVGVRGPDILRQRSRFRGFGALMSERRIRDLVTGYFARFYGSADVVQRAILHEQMDLEENSRPGGTNNSHWHFDRTPSVKCAVFLNDIELSCGPFQAIAGSHRWTRPLSLSQLRTNPDPIFVDNYVTFATEPEWTSFTLRAGSVVVFDTFIVHRGGGVSGDGYRKTIRMVTWPPLMNSAYLTMPEDVGMGAPPPAFETDHPYDRTGQSTRDARHLFVG